MPVQNMFIYIYEYNRITQRTRQTTRIRNNNKSCTRRTKTTNADTRIFAAADAHHIDWEQRGAHVQNSRRCASKIPRSGRKVSFTENLTLDRSKRTQRVGYAFRRERDDDRCVNR